MLERKRLNKLIVMTLTKTELPVRASELYCFVKERKPEILRVERVRTFKSFVKVINSFPQVEAFGTGTKRYILKNGPTE